MYSKENFIRVRQEFERKHYAAQELAEEHRRQAEKAVPELAEIHRALGDTGFRIFGETVRGGDNLQERLDRIREENRQLQQAQADLLQAAGFPADYTAVHYECSVCNDTGYENDSHGAKMCTCMKRALILAGYESSGIGQLMKTQRFDTFSLSYYRPGQEAEVMQDVLRRAKEYCRDFSADKSDNIIMFGNTGLGKTHLSTAIAVDLIDRGFDVVYDSAQNIFEKYERVHFGRRDSEDAGDDTEQYLSCDLLIMDDLGTEMTTQYTVSVLYHLLNTRMTSGRSTIVNTNLNYDMLNKRYGNRTVSRLLGEYRQFQFVGQDVRMIKVQAARRGE